MNAINDMEHMDGKHEYLFLTSNKAQVGLTHVPLLTLYLH